MFYEISKSVDSEIASDLQACEKYFSHLGENVRLLGRLISAAYTEA